MRDRKSVSLTEEQRAVGRALRENHGANSFRICCHAGTGKTTSMACFIANRDVSGKHVLWLAYNRGLKESTLELMRRQSCPASLTQPSQRAPFPEETLTVTTLDAVLRQYDPQAPGDFQVVLERVARGYGSLPAGSILAQTDLMIIDEAQDLTHQYVSLLTRLAEDAFAESKAQVQVLLVGDPRQTIYEYRQAQSKYLTQGDVWSTPPFKPLSVDVLSLQVTQRLSQPLVRVVNDLFRSSLLLHASDWREDMVSHEGTGGPGETSTQTGVATSSFACTNDAAYAAQWVQEQCRSPPVSLALLSGSRKPNQAVWILARLLGQEPYNFPPPQLFTESEGLSPEETAASIRWTVSTVHGSKGGTYDVVVLLLEAGSSVWRSRKFRERIQDASQARLNGYLLYVATTRARRSLLVLDASSVALDNLSPLPLHLGWCQERGYSCIATERATRLDPRSGFFARAWTDFFMEDDPSWGAVAALSLDGVDFAWEAVAPQDRRVKVPLEALSDADLSLIQGALHLFLLSSFKPDAEVELERLFPELAGLVRWVLSSCPRRPLCEVLAETNGTVSCLNPCAVHPAQSVWDQESSTWSERPWLELSALLARHQYGFFRNAFHQELAAPLLRQLILWSCQMRLQPFLATCHDLNFSSEPLYHRGQEVVLIKLGRSEDNETSLLPDRGIRGIACLLFCEMNLQLKILDWPQLGRSRVQRDLAQQATTKARQLLEARRASTARGPRGPIRHLKRKSET